MSTHLHGPQVPNEGLPNVSTLSSRAPGPCLPYHPNPLISLRLRVSAQFYLRGFHPRHLRVGVSRAVLLDLYVLSFSWEAGCASGWQAQITREQEASDWREEAPRWTNDGSSRASYQHSSSNVLEYNEHVLSRKVWCHGNMGKSALESVSPAERL